MVHENRYSVQNHTQQKISERQNIYSFVILLKKMRDLNITKDKELLYNSKSKKGLTTFRSFLRQKKIII